MFHVWYADNDGRSHNKITRFGYHNLFPSPMNWNGFISVEKALEGLQWGNKDIDKRFERPFIVVKNDREVVLTYRAEKDDATHCCRRNGATVGCQCERPPVEDLEGPPELTLGFTGGSPAILFGGKHVVHLANAGAAAAYLPYVKGLTQRQ